MQNFVGGMIVGLMCSAAVAMGEQSLSAPIRLAAMIGRFRGPHYAVCWYRRKIRYRNDESQTSVAPSVADGEMFWAAVDRIGVWSGNARYDDLEICDGTQ